MDEFTSTDVILTALLVVPILGGVYLFFGFWGWVGLGVVIAVFLSWLAQT